MKNKVFFTDLSGEFAQALAKCFEADGFEITTEIGVNIEYFIDTTDFHPAGDDKKVGEGILAEAGREAFMKNVCEPIDLLDRCFYYMVGKKRICFLSSSASSISMSQETAGFGHNMAKAALHQILTITKNGLIERGFTFRLFDPLTGEYPPEKAAASAFVYFTRDRYIDNDDDKSREDERNLLLRDAKGREIPW